MRRATESMKCRALRIGVVEDGRVIDERLFRQPATISVGRSERSTFTLFAPGLPARFGLFRASGGGYRLNLREGITGRIANGGRVSDLEELRRVDVARGGGSRRGIQLDDQARGKLVLGDSMMMFQFVDPPPLRPRPQLPVAVRGGPFRGVDRFILVLFLVSLAIHGGVIGWWESADWPARSMEQRWSDLLHVIDPAAPPFLVQQAADPQREGPWIDVPETAEPQRAPTRNRRKKAAASEPEQSPEQRARARAEARADVLARAMSNARDRFVILGSNGGEGGSVADVLGGIHPGVDMDDLMALVDNPTAATEARGALDTYAGGKGSGEVADIDQIRMRGSDATVRTEGAGRERKIRSRVRRSDPRTLGGTGFLDTAEVNRIVKRGLGAIKGCYERALRRDPTLEGKVAVRFTVIGTGRVSRASTPQNELTPEVGACITSAFQRFRFPPPDGGQAVFEYPFFFTPAR